MLRINFVSRSNNYIHCFNRSLYPPNKIKVDINLPLTWPDASHIRDTLSGNVKVVFGSHKGG